MEMGFDKCWGDHAPLDIKGLLAGCNLILADADDLPAINSYIHRFKRCI
jgi:hypothetical protein